MTPEQLSELTESGAARVADAASIEALDALESELVGRQSELHRVKGLLGTLDPAERKLLGRALNDARSRLESAIAARRAELATVERRARLSAERLDLTEGLRRNTIGRDHVVTRIREELEDVFVGLGFTVAEGPEVETDWYNFTALNLPEAHPARSLWDTLYLNLGDPESILLRTHTSPVQIRVMESGEPPIAIVAPGRVYRRDTADATHMPVFHQIEGLVIDRGITLGDLAGTIDAFTKAIFGADTTSRLRPSFFPFTEPSAEFDVQLADGSWLELGGCGMVHPNVLTNCGIDPEEYSGFAFGFGIDRFAFLRYGLDDLRSLYSNDLRVLAQF